MTDIPNRPTAVSGRLGVTASIVGDDFVVSAEPRPEVMRLGALRAAAIVYAIDVVAGVTCDVDDNAWTFTSDLTFQCEPVREGSIHTVARILRQGARSSTCEVFITDDTGRNVGYSTAGFALVPRRPEDPPKMHFDMGMAVEIFGQIPTLEEPLRDAMGIEVLDAEQGVMELALRDDLRNPAGALQGAMVAALAEAAAEDLFSAHLGAPALVTGLEIRYLGQGRVGPVRTRAQIMGDGPAAPVRVQLYDVSSGKLLTHVTAHARTI